LQKVVALSAAIINDNVEDSTLSTLLNVLTSMIDNGHSTQSTLQFSDDDDDDEDDDNNTIDAQTNTSSQQWSDAKYSDSDSDEEPSTRRKRRRRTPTAVKPALVPFLRKQLSSFTPLFDMLIHRASQQPDNRQRARNMLRCVALSEFLRSRQAHLALNDALPTPSSMATLARQPTALRSMWLAFQTDSELGLRKKNVFF